MKAVGVELDFIPVDNGFVSDIAAYEQYLPSLFADLLQGLVLYIYVYFTPLAGNLFQSVNGNDNFLFQQTANLLIHYS